MTRKSYPVRPLPAQTFTASALQVRRAYEARYGVSPTGMTYEDAGNRIFEEMGLEAAKAFILGQSSDPTISVGLEAN